MKKLLPLIVFPFVMLCGYRSKPEFKFQKIIFHTTHCYGTCPVFHLEVDSDQTALFSAPDGVKVDYGRFSTAHNTPQYAYFFKGTLSDSTFTKLVETVAAIGMDTLKIDRQENIDLPMITFIVYYNGKRKFLQSSMISYNKATPLYNLLLSICQNTKLHPVNTAYTPFKIEGE